MGGCWDIAVDTLSTLGSLFSLPLTPCIVRVGDRSLTPIMQAQAVESRRLARLARDQLGEYAPEGYGRIGDNTEDWLSPLNTSAVAMGDQLAPFGTSDTSLGSSKEKVSET